MCRETFCPHDNLFLVYWDDDDYDDNDDDPFYAVSWDVLGFWHV